MVKVELLAPAKDLACAQAAIDCGADAIYIGAAKFGARQAAGNSLIDIAAATQYAHKFWAKVYVTLNTLVLDQEIAETKSLINELYNIGIDGLIIQDTGLIELTPADLPLIASTQMHNTTLEKIIFLEKCGFQRVILPREFSLKDIKQVKEHSQIELECFVHGALCDCYSGQCYLSLVKGGRSANRGQCAQPCRKPYQVLDSNKKLIRDNYFPLSLKDLNLADHLGELLDSGVSSFKIEGRLKDINYIKNTVSFYRQTLDKHLGTKYQRSSSGTLTYGFTPDPDKTFNRGWTDYLFKKRSKVCTGFTPKAIGAKLGTIQRLGKIYFELDTPVALNNGDGLCFLDSNSQLQGTTLNSSDAGRYFPDKMNGLKVGTIVYRNLDRGFIQQLNNNSCLRQIALNMTLTETDQGLELSACDADQVQVSVQLNCQKIPAQNPEYAQELLRKQLTSTGNTLYRVTELQLKLERIYIFSHKELNTWRRELLARLTVQREIQRPKNILRKTLPAKYPQPTLNYQANVANKLAERFYREHGVVKIEPAAELNSKFQGPLMVSKYCLRYELGLCGKHADNSALYLREAEGLLRLDFDCLHCQMLVSVESHSLNRSANSPC